MENNNNIFFLVEDIIHSDDDNAADIYTKSQNIDKMMNELLDEDDDISDIYDPSHYNIDQSTLEYYIDKNKYRGEEEVYYNSYTIKDLMKICQYYGIAKDIRGAKCKKQDIVSTIVFFEAQPENYKIVNKRHTMWAYMMELTLDPKMKAYVLWN